MVEYLTAKIVEAKRTERPRWGMTRMGYTLTRGAPTSLLIRLDGETRFRRLMVWCFSNIGTCFVRIRGQAYIVPDYTIPEE